MKYCSTRGSVRAASFKDALFSGYTLDGGLFVPEIIPKLSKEKVQNWLQTKPSYKEVVFEIVRLYIAREEIPDNDLKECVDKAYSNSKFDIPELIGMKECKTKNGKLFKVAKLFLGPTASFKDYALSLVGQLMEYFLKKKKDHVVVLVGTSGDTGSAAIKAMEGLNGVDIIVLYPDGQISPVQELQMNSSQAENVHVFAVAGTSDDLDVPIRLCFPDKKLCSINSINWSRIMVQIAHFVYLYFQAGEELAIFVPTGAGGNLAAGVLASLMGSKIKLFVATNENDNVHAFLNKGELRMGGEIIATPANAMDIRYPYNLERIIYFLSNSAEKTASYMKICEASSDSVTIDEELLKKIKSIIIESRVVTTSEIKETIKWCWNTNAYVICPHTATALALLNSCNESGPSVIISTASPFKFPEVITSLGIPIQAWNGDKLFWKLKSSSQVPPNRSMTKKNISKWVDVLQKEIKKIRNKPSLNGRS